MEFFERVEVANFEIASDAFSSFKVWSVWLCQGGRGDAPPACCVVWCCVGATDTHTESRQLPRVTLGQLQGVMQTEAGPHFNTGLSRVCCTTRGPTVCMLPALCCAVLSPPPRTC